MVERFFAETTDKRIRRGIFRSVAELQSAIMTYLEQHNANPKPFVWTAPALDILEKVARAKQALESLHWRSLAELLLECPVPLLAAPLLPSLGGATMAVLDIETPARVSLSA